MEFLNHFDNVFTLYHIALLVGGTLAGLILGALPGLSPTMAVALMIPFTFHMQPAAGLILLGAMYTATVAGGAISAILVNVPGAPANIATALDGHQLAKKGRAAEALHYCFMSSFIGGIIGIFVLIFFTPPLAELALKFGPTELFWIAILGITIIGTIGSESVVKGLFAGLFGLALSTIGDNPMLGEDRFVFSQHLESGIHIVTALIGLFAVPQVFSLLEQSLQHNDSLLHTLGESRLMRSLKYNLTRVRALSIGSLVGVIVGIIPGAGGQIAGLVAYDQVKKTSRDASKFGTGEPDGIIAAESANNAMVGPSLVPLLTLSIPGSPTAAVLLGGLLIHGLFPGPDLFTIHGEVTWTFINSLLVAQVLMLIIGLILSQHSGWIMKVPGHYMAAAILVLAVYGTYSIQSSYSDVLIMFVLGLIMFFGGKLGFGPAPLVLGIILGPIAEDNFLQGQLIGQSSGSAFAYFTSGVINLTLISICIGSIIYSVYSDSKSKRRQSAHSGIRPTHTNQATQANQTTQGWSAFFAVLLGIIFSAAAFWNTDPEVYLFPRIAAGFMLLLALVHGADFMIKKKSHSADSPSMPQGLFSGLAGGLTKGLTSGLAYKGLLPGIIIGIIYVLIMEQLGFYTSSLLMFIIITSIYGRRSTLAINTIIYKVNYNIIVGSIFMVVLYLLFWKLLNVRTPTGILF